MKYIAVSAAWACATLVLIFGEVQAQDAIGGAVVASALIVLLGD